MKRIYSLVFLTFMALTTLTAGNPDRQGEAGAAQLLMNPWAPSAGLHSMTTANVLGVEALRINPAGLSRMSGTEVMLGYANYMQGTGISQQALGIGANLGGGGAIGFSLHSLDFGDIPVTTGNQPAGTGSDLNLSFINIGLSYSYTFEQSVSVGVTLRGVTEGTSEVSSFGIAVDAGIQYVTGDNDEFKFGVSLRNIGSRMRYSGQGLSVASETANPRDDFNVTFNQRAAGFEMPSMLNIGASYDLLSGSKYPNHRVTLIGNFTANSFSLDQLGAGVEYAFREQFVGRLAYKSDLGDTADFGAPLYEGLSVGASIRVPFQKADPSKRISFDYAYRSTRIYDGTHNFGLSLML